MLRHLLRIKSKINDQTTPSCPDTVIKTREKHADSIDADFVMGEDISFSSPSGAAAFVAGASRNGYTEWHTEEGIMLKDVKRSSLETFMGHIA